MMSQYNNSQSSALISEKEKPNLPVRLVFASLFVVISSTSAWAANTTYKGIYQNKIQVSWSGKLGSVTNDFLPGQQKLRWNTAAIYKVGQRLLGEFKHGNEVTYLSGFETDKGNTIIWNTRGNAGLFPQFNKEFDAPMVWKRGQANIIANRFNGTIRLSNFSNRAMNLFLVNGRGAETPACFNRGNDCYAGGRANDLLANKITFKASLKYTNFILRDAEDQAYVGTFSNHKQRNKEVRIQRHFDRRASAPADFEWSVRSYPRYKPIDYDTIADHFAPKKLDPTVLWLNFEGASGFQTVQNGGCGPSPVPTAHRSLDGSNWLEVSKEVDSKFNCIPNPIQKHTYSDEEIEEILFRVAELYSPFNVSVARLDLDTYFDQSAAGNTTVFVGKTEDTKKINFALPGSSDSPRRYFVSDKISYEEHRPNSNPFDVAFVGEVKSNFSTLAKIIAHEAGHTFGLLHQRWSKNSIMRPHDLPTFGHFDNEYTQLNDDDPNNDKWHKPLVKLPNKQNLVSINDQNSFLFLAKTLGPEREDDHPNFVNQELIGGKLMFSKYDRVSSKWIIPAKDKDPDNPSYTYVSSENSNVIRDHPFRLGVKQMESGHKTLKVDPSSRVVEHSVISRHAFGKTIIDYLGDYDVFELDADAIPIFGGPNRCKDAAEMKNISIRVTALDGRLDPVILVFDKDKLVQAKDANGNPVKNSNGSPKMEIDNAIAVAVSPESDPSITIVKFPALGFPYSSNANLGAKMKKDEFCNLSEPQRKARIRELGLNKYSLVVGGRSGLTTGPYKISVSVTP